MRIFNLFPITPRDLTCIPVRDCVAASFLASEVNSERPQ